MSVYVLYLDEGVEAHIFLLSGFDLLQSPGLVAAEASSELLEPLTLCATKLQVDWMGGGEIEIEIERDTQRKRSR